MHSHLKSVQMATICKRLSHLYIQRTTRRTAKLSTESSSKATSSTSNLFKTSHLLRREKIELKKRIQMKRLKLH